MNPQTITTVTCDSGPRYGRPAEHSGPPTALFNKALALLRYELDHLDELTPSPVMMDPVFNLVTTATDYFQDEDARGTVKPDGVWFEEPFAYLIFE